MRALHREPQKWATLLILALALFAPVPAAPHDTHISYCVAKLTATEFTGNVTYFRDDLAKALKNWRGIDLARLNAQQGTTAIANYLREHFKVTADGNRALALAVTQRIDDGTSIGLRFRFVAAGAIRTLAIDNRALFNEYNDQMNLLLVETRSGEHNFIMTRSSPAASVRP